MKDADSTGSEPKSAPSIWFRQLPLETETCLFILVNALDVFMTYRLLSHGPEFQESNGIANFILSNYGFRGVVYFKFALVAFVSVIAQVIARSRPRTAKTLLNTGTVIVSLVVLYSLYLWVRYSGYFG